MSKISTIWSALEAKLITISGPNQPLGCVVSDDFKIDVLTKDFASYPAAVITTPSFTSQVDTNRENKRTYEFQILFVIKGDNNQDAKSVADLQEVIVDLFDNDPTLKDKDDQAIPVFTEPAFSQTITLNTHDQEYIIFTVTVKTDVIINLTY